MVWKRPVYAQKILWGCRIPQILTQKERVLIYPAGQFGADQLRSRFSQPRPQQKGQIEVELDHSDDQPARQGAQAGQVQGGRSSSRLTEAVGCVAERREAHQRPHVQDHMEILRLMIFVL